jgi:hypothetical protein
MDPTSNIEPTLSFGLPIKPSVGRLRKGKVSRHWIYYHDPVKLRIPIGYDIPMYVETARMLDRRRLIGDVVHLITSVEAGTRYQLVGYFQVQTTEVLPATWYSPRPMLSIGTRMACEYRKRVELNGAAWFRELTAKGGLKGGLRWVRDPAVIAALLECAGTVKKRTVVRG